MGQFVFKRTEDDDFLPVNGNALPNFGGGLMYNSAAGGGGGGSFCGSAQMGGGGGAIPNKNGYWAPQTSLGFFPGVIFLIICFCSIGVF